MPKERGTLMWFEFSDRYTFKAVSEKKGRPAKKVIEKGQKVEMFIFAAHDTYDHEEKEAVSLIIGNSTFDFSFDAFETLKNHLVLPKECMMSGVGDIFCVKDKIVFAVMHFGKSGWWGYNKKLLCNPQNFNYCPNCGNRMVEFPPFPGRSSKHPMCVFKHIHLYRPPDRPGVAETKQHSSAEITRANPFAANL